MGTMIESDTVKALTIIFPRDGGQSIVIKSYCVLRYDNGSFKNWVGLISNRSSFLTDD